MRTYTPKPGDVERTWYVIDATDVVLGRLATHVATLLRGKHKPTFAPHVDTGDFVIVVNAAKIALTGNKADTKLAYRHSGYPGGLKAIPYSDLLAKHPERVIEKPEHPYTQALVSAIPWPDPERDWAPAEPDRASWNRPAVIHTGATSIG